MKMGTSLDKDDHPKSYYEKLYLEKMNAKNKRTRSNNIFGRDQILNSKRERNDTKEKKEKDKDQDDEEYIAEEENENNSEQENEEEIEDENINESSEKNEQTEEKKKKTNLKYKRMATKELVEKNKNYKEIGIKYTRLIPMKKKKTEQNKALYLINEQNTKNIISNHNNKSNEIIEEENHSEEENFEKDNNKAHILKSGKNHQQNIAIENNEFHQANKDIDKTPNNKKDITLTVKENYNSEKSPQSNQQILFNSDINHISFGAPKTFEKNNLVSLSKGPISFGFNQSTNSKNLENTELKKDNQDNNQSDIKEKRYGTFVKNISEAVKENIRDSQRMENKKAKTIFLKWESPRQKEFLSHSMDNCLEENGGDEINVEYNFNERINKIEDDENQKLKKGNIKMNTGYSPFNTNNYIQLNEGEHQERPNSKILKSQNDNNEYKYKLRSYDRNNKQINEDKEAKDNNNNELKIIKNPFYTDVNQNNAPESDYTESHNIYGSSIPPENVFNSDVDLNPNNEYYYNMNNNINEKNNMNLEEKNQNIADPFKNNYRNSNYTDTNYNYVSPNIKSGNIDNINNDYYRTLEDKIKYDNQNTNINFNDENERQNNIFENELDINNQEQEQKAHNKRKSRFLNKISGIKNSVMNKFKCNAYLLPLLLLILFGIVYFLNNSYERFENIDIIIVFSILMGLLVLYNIFKYFNTLRNYKKMAKADRIALLDKLQNENITRDTLANNMMLINNFINERIEFHHIAQDEYMKYVFHCLKKYLKKDGFELNIGNNDGNDIEFWKRI